MKKTPEMHDALFASAWTLVEEHLSELATSVGLNVTDFATCLASERFTNEIQASVSQAERLGLNGTPSFLIGTLENDGTTMHNRKENRRSTSLRTLQNWFGRDTADQADTFAVTFGGILAN